MRRARPASTGLDERTGAAPATPSTIGTRVPDERWIGLYRIADVERRGEAVIFWEETGALLGHAGFAYLPDHSTASFEGGTFEDPELHPLGGPWYAWTAGW